MVVQIALWSVLIRWVHYVYMQILRLEMVGSLRARAILAFGTEAWVRCTCKLLGLEIKKTPGKPSGKRGKSLVQIALWFALVSSRVS